VADTAIVERRNLVKAASPHKRQQNSTLRPFGLGESPVNSLFLLIADAGIALDNGLVINVEPGRFE